MWLQKRRCMVDVESLAGVRSFDDIIDPPVKTIRDVPTGADAQSTTPNQSGKPCTKLLVPSQVQSTTCRRMFFRSIPVAQILSTCPHVPKCLVDMPCYSLTHQQSLDHSRHVVGPLGVDIHCPHCNKQILGGLDSVHEPRHSEV
jgi:hypothetical protein